MLNSSDEPTEATLSNVLAILVQLMKRHAQGEPVFAEMAARIHSHQFSEMAESSFDPLDDTAK